jgi:ribosomal-protein-alanine N-acetyltransferase
MFVVRRFRLEDLNRVHEIEKRSFKDPYPLLILLNLYELYPETFLVAERDGLVVGYLIARPTDRKGHILSLATDPRYRNQGVGRTLIGTIVDFFRRRKAREIWLEVRVSNQRAVRFYKNLGFLEVGKALRYYADGEDAIVLKKGLEASPLMPHYRTGEPSLPSFLRFP